MNPPDVWLPRLFLGGLLVIVLACMVCCVVLSVCTMSDTTRLSIIVSIIGLAGTALGGFIGYLIPNQGQQNQLNRLGDAMEKLAPREVK